jgi:hypothetical protein
MLNTAGYWSGSNGAEGSKLAAGLAADRLPLAATHGAICELIR